MKNQFIFFFFLILTLGTGGLIFSKIKNSDVSKVFNSSFNEALKTFSDFFKNSENFKVSYKVDSNLEATSSTSIEYDDIQKDEVNLNNIETPISTSTPRPRVTSIPTQKPKKVNSQPLVCNRFTVSHLDGSSSTLCYSNTDFNSLQSLNSRLISAKSNYSFEKSVYEMYQKAYEAHNSDIYLEPIAEAKQNMQKYQDLIGEISLQMYNIESRGY